MYICGSTIKPHYCFNSWYTYTYTIISTNQNNTFHR